MLYSSMEASVMRITAGGSSRRSGRSDFSMASATMLPRTLFVVLLLPAGVEEEQEEKLSIVV